MKSVKGVAYAVLSSSTFGLAPFFSVSLLLLGLSSFEVLFYRWGIAALFLFVVTALSGACFRLGRKEVRTVLMLSIFRAVTSFSLIVAYQNLATGFASTIHFMYPLAVALGMMFFFGERKSLVVLVCVLLSLIGAAILSLGDIRSSASQGHLVAGIVAACLSVFSYAAYIIGVRKSCAVRIHSGVLTCYVMGIGAFLFFCGAWFTSGGVTWISDLRAWGYVAGLALPATAISNIALVQAVKHAGPTLTSILGAMEPLTAVVVGIVFFHEAFTAWGAVGMSLILVAVTLAMIRTKGKVSP